MRINRALGSRKDSRHGLSSAKLLTMQKNYQFEKRRKEMDKKAKKEEKRRAKLAAAQPIVAGNPPAETAPVENI
jgi:hypothetical protein